MPGNLNGLLWVLLLVGPLIILQRSLHRQSQAILLLLTRRPEIALSLFSIMFFPGVLLHESSHYIMARILWVPTGRLSLIPRPLGGGRLQLGFVETASTDWLRDALIGAAPLIAGGIFVAYAGLARMGLFNIWVVLTSQGMEGLLIFLPNLFKQPDFWLWFYLAFAVSSTMLPSASDRRAWLPMGFSVVLVLGMSLIFGAGPWLVEHLALPLNRTLLAIAVVFGISILIHLVLLPPLWGLHLIISKILGLEVV